MSTPVSHLGTDWKDQWARVQRWYERISRHGNNLPEDYMVEAKALALDDVFAFYMNCYHLRDWLKESGARTNEELNRFFDENAIMELCRDVCDGLKHYRIDTSHRGARMRPRANPQWTTTQDPETLMPPEPARWYFVGTTGRHDMFTTADQCVAAWRRNGELSTVVERPANAVDRMLGTLIWWHNRRHNR